MVKIAKQKVSEFTNVVNVYSGYSREYCIKVLTTESWFFDMRLWDKPKKEITESDIILWMLRGGRPTNAGHLNWVITDALSNNTLTFHEIVFYLSQNKQERESRNLGEYAPGNAYYKDKPYSNFFTEIGYVGHLKNYVSLLMYIPL